MLRPYTIIFPGGRLLRVAHALVLGSQAHNLAYLPSGGIIPWAERAVVIPTYYLVAYRRLYVPVERVCRGHIPERWSNGSIKRPGFGQRHYFS